MASTTCEPNSCGSSIFNEIIVSSGSGSGGGLDLSSSTFNGVNGASDSPLITNVTSTTFDISAGTLYFYDYSIPEVPVETVVNFPLTTGIAGTLLGSAAIIVTYVSINTSGTVLQSGGAPTGFATETEILIGNINHMDGASPPSDVFFPSANHSPDTTYKNIDALRQYMMQKGGVNLEGCIISAVPGLATFQNSAGVGLRFGAAYATTPETPHYNATIAQNPVGTIFLNYINTLGNFIGGVVTALDTLNFNNAGVLTALGPNRWQIFKVFYAYGSNVALVYYGNASYATEPAARLAIFTEEFTEHPVTLVGAPRAFIIAETGQTNSSNYTFITTPNERGAFGAGGTGTNLGASDGFSAGLVSNVTILPNTLTLVLWNSVTFDDSSNYGSGTGIYTVPTDGLYQFHFNIRGGTSASGEFETTIRVNGSSICHDTSIGGISVANHGASCSAICRCSAADTVECFIFQTSFLNATLFNSPQSSFSGARIGA